VYCFNELGILESLPRIAAYTLGSDMRTQDMRARVDKIRGPFMENFSISFG